MAEIDINRKINSSLLFRHIYLFVLMAAILPSIAYSQPSDSSRNKKKKVELLHADLMINARDQGGEFKKLLGNVSLNHYDIRMFCDSAYLYQNRNQVKAFSKVHIKQGDTLDLYGNYLFYDGAEQKAIVKGNVELIDKETHLYTTSASYDVANKIASYNNGGRITNSKNVLTSIIGLYYSEKKMFHFKDSVKIVNPDYVMTGDTMDYNTVTETAFFTGPSEVKGDSIYLYSERGWYDTKNNVMRIWENSLIDNKQQIIKGDSLFYEKKTGYGQAFRNISIIDTSKNVMVKGDYAWYNKKPEKFMVTDRATFIQISKNDSLFLHADTISAVTVVDTAGKPFRLMRAYYGCRIFSKDLQSKCDSLSYSFQDSVIRLYHAPVIWSDENQLTSDSIAIFTKNRQAERMELYSSAFITINVDSVRYNQIKGRSLTGYFRNNKLYKINIVGNSEAIYFLPEKDEIIGVNHAKSSSIEIYVDNGKITSIYAYQNPEGKLDPPLQNTLETLKLSGFSWLDILRPKKVSDIFKK
jgi:lipopolysaccharide export system protein LptA